MTESKFPDQVRAARSSEARKREASAARTTGAITLVSFIRLMADIGYERCNPESTDSVHFEKKKNAPKQSRSLPSHLTMTKPSLEMPDHPFGRVYDSSQIVDFLMRVYGSDEGAAEIHLLAHLNQKH